MEKQHKKLISRTGNALFDIVTYVILTVLGFITLYPMWYILIVSVSSAQHINLGDISFWPRGLNFEAYKIVFENEKIWRSYANTIGYTVVGTMINLALTMMLAYPLSRKNFCLRKPILFLAMFTMYFSGGMIPTFLWMSDLHLYNTRAVLVLLPAINVFNLIIAMNYIKNSIPEELYEAASLDGYGHIQYFTKIVLPLSQTIEIVLILYYGVAHWNEFMNGLIYIRDEALYPLQLTLRAILLQNQASSLGDVDSMMEQQKAAELIKYGLIIVSSLPVMVIYPFVQKHFSKGVMLGSIKG